MCDFLVDDEAKDISRITDIPWSWQRVHQRGVLRPFLDLRNLDWWDRWRVVWAQIGGWTYLDAVN